MIQRPSSVPRQARSRSRWLVAGRRGSRRQAVRAVEDVSARWIGAVRGALRLEGRLQGTFKRFHPTGRWPERSAMREAKRAGAQNCSAQPVRAAICSRRPIRVLADRDRPCDKGTESRARCSTSEASSWSTTGPCGREMHSRRSTRYSQLPSRRVSERRHVPAWLATFRRRRRANAMTSCFRSSDWRGRSMPSATRISMQTDRSRAARLARDRRRSGTARMRVARDADLATSAI